MNDKRTTVEQPQAQLQADVKVLAEKIAQAINAPKAGNNLARMARK